MPSCSFVSQQLCSCLHASLATSKQQHTLPSTSHLPHCKKQAQSVVDIHSTFQRMGYSHIQTWCESAHTCYEDQVYSTPVSFGVLEGSMTVILIDSNGVESVHCASTGQCVTVPAHTVFAMRVGGVDCRFVLGDMTSV
jgi:hypothetical protein